jgi:hypothetical protein
MMFPQGLLAATVIHPALLATDDAGVFPRAAGSGMAGLLRLCRKSA